MEELLGKDVGRYHIVERLGEGGMAVVYKAYDTRLERDVAIKFIRTDAIPPNQLEKILLRFERESKILARMKHPHIISIFDYGEYNHVPYLVMDYISGGTLKRMMTGQPFPYQDAVRLILPVADALDYAHQMNIVHRDVKPANILVTPRGSPMLSDFGIARMMDSGEHTLTGTGASIGTPDYMAPEQWLGQSGMSVDIYALGVVFYELITGRVPYRADTPLALMVKQTQDPLPRPSQFVGGLPDKVEQVVFKALAKGVSDRYQDMKSFIQALEQLLVLDGNSGPTVLMDEQVTLPSQSPASRQVGESASAVENELDRDSHARSFSGSNRPAEAGKKFPLIPVAVGILAIIILGIMGLGAAGIGPAASLFFPPTQVAEIIPTVIEATDIPVKTPPPLPATFTPTTFEIVATPSPVNTLVPDVATQTEIGTTITWQKDGMVMVYVPEGPFTMGCDSAHNGEDECDPAELPSHTVSLDAFWMDRTEVTNAMFAEFVRATNYKTDAEKAGTGWVLTGGAWTEVKKVTWQHPAGENSDITGKDQHPVVLVSWNDASAYCAWAGKRLPTEAEWEKAARGATDTRRYPWGDQAASCRMANYTIGCVGSTMPVGSYPEGASLFGALDMGGNVQEWVYDWYDDNYYNRSPEKNPLASDAGDMRVLRGGSWSQKSMDLRVTSRSGYEPEVGGTGHGFRCASTESTPVINATSTGSQKWTIITNSNANLRSGPGMMYDLVTSISSGTALDVVGRSENGAWLVVNLPQLQKNAWISKSLVTINFEINAVPVIKAPPVPTTKPTPRPESPNQGSEPNPGTGPGITPSVTPITPYPYPNP